DEPVAWDREADSPAEGLGSVDVDGRVGKVAQIRIRARRELRAGDRQPVSHKPRVFQLDRAFEEISRSAELNAIEIELVGVNLIEHQRVVRCLEHPFQTQSLRVETDW